MAALMLDQAEEMVDMVLRRHRSPEAAAAAFRARGHPDDPDEVMELEDFISDIYSAWRPEKVPKLSELFEKYAKLPGGLGGFAANAIEKIVMRERPDVAMDGGG